MLFRDSFPPPRRPPVNSGLEGWGENRASEQTTKSIRLEFIWGVEGGGEDRKAMRERVERRIMGRGKGGLGGGRRLREGVVNGREG